MKKGTLILICGLPGAGKTTLAKKLEIERHAITMCPDDWIEYLLEDKTDVIERDRLRDPVEQLLWKQAQKHIQLGENVILENGFWSQEERNSYRDTARNLGAKVELHYLPLDRDKLWERIEKRNKEFINPTFIMTKEEHERSNDVFEEPNQEELETYDAFKVYDQ